MPRINPETLRLRLSRGVAASLLLAPVFFALISCSYAANIGGPELRLELQQDLGSGLVLPVPGDEDWKVYRNARLGFEFQYPKSLVIRSNEPYQQAVIFAGSAGEIQNISGRVGIYQPVRESWVRKPNTFEQWYAEHEKPELRPGNYIKLSEEKVVVSGLDGIKVMYRNETGGLEQLTVRILISVPANREEPSPKVHAVHVMQFGGPWNEAQKPKYLAIYDRMLSSIKFFNPVR